MSAASTSLHTIDPVALSLPFWPHAIHWYGLMYLLAFGVAWWLGSRRARAGRLPGVDAEAWGDLLFYGMLGVVVGGRVGYVLFYAFGDFLADPLLLLRLNQGGMSFHGGLLGVLAVVWWWSRRRGLRLADTLDFIAPLVPQGLGFGRIGNYIGGELWGRPTGGDGGVVFRGALPEQYARLDQASLEALHATGALDVFARYPSQLYQAALEGLVLFVVLWWHSRIPRPRYRMIGLFALLYGVFRILVEFVREPDAHIGTLAFGWLTMGQLLSLPLVALGIWWLWRSRNAPVVAAQAPPAVPKGKGA